MNLDLAEPQRIMRDYLATHDVAFCCVGMGIGKTATTAVGILDRLADLQTSAALIVAPLRVATYTWPCEIAKWEQTRGIKVADIRTKEGKQAFLDGSANAYLINYESLHVVSDLLKKREGVLPYGIEVWDECFSGDTEVMTPAGPKHICDIREGEVVMSAVGEDTVLQTHAKEVTCVVCVSVDGRKTFCTYDHLFFTSKGWKKAGDLKTGDSLTSYQSVRTLWRKLRTKRPLERLEDEVLLKELFFEGAGSGEKESAECLRVLRGKFLAKMCGTPFEILREEVLGEMEGRNTRSCEGVAGGTPKSSRKTQSLLEQRYQGGFGKESKTTRTKQDARPSGGCEGVKSSPRERSQTSGKRRQRAQYTSPTTVSSRVGFRSKRIASVGTRSLYSRRVLRRKIHQLQNRCRGPVSHAGSRGRWVIPQLTKSAAARRKKRRDTCDVRVEGVEVVQQNDPRLDKFRDSEGRVVFYDLSVEKHPSYFANGSLVHNCTRAKSHSAKRINAFRRLPRASVRWGLTGTPTPNSLMDLFAQVRLLDDGQRLGKAFTRFRDTYFQPTDYMQYNWVPRPGAEEEIHAKIEDITLVLRSQDWLDIPDVQVVDVDVPLPADVMKRYKEFKKELLIEVDGKTLTAANAAVLILKLQQFTSGVIYDEERNHTTIHTAKIDALRKIKARPLLVAVQFRHEQDRIREAFPEAQFVEDHGSELFDRWNKGKVPMLVSHPASIGHGLNLQDGGCNLVWFSPTYNREHYEQMICRLARRGQTAETVVHRLICPGTVDEIVVEALRDKNEGENRLLEALKALKKQ